MRKLAMVSVLCFSLLPLSAFAQQVLRLRDGKTYNGRFVSGDSSGIVFRDSSGVNRRFALNRVESIDFTGAASTGVFGADRTAADSNFTIPEGTELSVRTNEAIDSETATAGQTFTATVASDVMNSAGQVVVPRGSRAQLVINEVESGGVVGSPTLALDLRSVTAGGRTYLVSTSDIERSGEGGLGANRRTATMVGGGAALGTLIGAIAGGGRGAAIGAAIGAAGGAATQVLTRGDKVKVPAETMLTFRLDQPLYLEALR